MNKQLYFIYILECSNGHYYTGYTTDLERRYQEHLAGSSKCKYTRSFPPRALLAYWQIEADLSQILRIEAAIKRLSKAKKLQLISKKPLTQALLLELDLA